MDRAELKLTADLALIDLDPDTESAFEQSVAELLDHFALMSTFDVGGLEPTTHALGEDNRVRPDHVDADPELPDQLLDQATDLEDRFISIPNVL